MVLMVLCIEIVPLNNILFIKKLKKKAVLFVLYNVLSAFNEKFADNYEKINYMFELIKFF